MSDRIERRIFGRSVCGKARQPCHPIELGGDSAIVNQGWIANWQSGARAGSASMRSHRWHWNLTEPARPADCWGYRCLSISSMPKPCAPLLDAPRSRCAPPKGPCLTGFGRKRPSPSYSCWIARAAKRLQHPAQQPRPIPYTSDNSDRAMETARTITDGMGMSPAVRTGMKKPPEGGLFFPSSSQLMTPQGRSGAAMVLAGAQRRVDVAPIEATSAHENLQTVQESVFMAAWPR